MKTSELLTEAHDYLAEHGHCKGDLKTEDGRVCLSGAIAGALMNRGLIPAISTRGITNGARDAWSNAGLAISREIDGTRNLFNVAAWNDSSSTTKEDVLLMMKRAAHTCEQNGD